MIIEHIHLSQTAKDQLIRLKRATGIKNWNILCRWALCLSLADPTIPPLSKIIMDSNVEMSWKVFGGEYHEVYLALIKERCNKDGLGTNDEVLSTQFRLHLHRGINFLASKRDIKSIGSFFKNLNADESL